MSRKRPLPERLAKFAGLNLIADWRIEKYAQARYLERLFAAGAVDCVFDVGANAGQFRDFLRNEVGFEGHIISFEPIPEHADAMRRRGLRDRRWTIENCALGPAPAKAAFNVMQSTQFSSFMMPRHEDGMFATQNAVVRKIEVDVVTLDDAHERLRARLGFSVPYLKLDTQGYELQVVAGATDRIGEFIAVQSEASVKPIYESMPGYQETIAWFCSRGFELSAMFPNNPEHFPRLVEFDCHFVASSAVARLAGK